MSRRADLPRTRRGNDGTYGIGIGREWATWGCDACGGTKNRRGEPGGRKYLGPWMTRKQQTATSKFHYDDERPLDSNPESGPLN